MKPEHSPRPSSTSPGNATGIPFADDELADVASNPPRRRIGARSRRNSVRAAAQRQCLRILMHPGSVPLRDGRLWRPLPKGGSPESLSSANRANESSISETRMLPLMSSDDELDVGPHPTTTGEVTTQGYTGPPNRP